LPVELFVDQASVSAARGTDYSGRLVAPNYEQSMYVHLTANAPPGVRAFVNAGDYPRAFIFEVPSSNRPNIEPKDDAMEVRITDPPQLYAFKPALDVPLKVKVEVDAPEQSFNNEDGKSYVRVWLDWDRDGVFRNERYVQRYSDRKVIVRAKSLLPDGTLTLNTEVGDLELDLEVTASGKAADLRAQLVTPYGNSESLPVEIRPDREPPQIYAALHPVAEPGNRIERGTDLEVHVFTEQQAPDLSGIAEVKAAFEMAVGSGAKVNWVEAKSSGREWIATLPTKELLPGTYTVLYYAIDNVKNESAVKEEQVTIYAKEAAESAGTSAEPDPANSLSGRVFYGDLAVAAHIELLSAAGAAVQGKSKEDGSFFFPKIPPGAYNLKAASLRAVRNKRRTAEMPVTIPPRPARTAPITVQLR
jgi:hypothetical protein